MNELQVGDVVYTDSHYHGLTRNKITRVTKTRAFTDKGGFTREYGDNGRIYSYPRDTGWHRNDYWIVTTELMAKYEKQIRVKFLADVKWHEHNIETLIEVMKAIGE